MNLNRSLDVLVAMAAVFWTRLSNSLFVDRLPKFGKIDAATVDANAPKKDFKNFAFREDIGVGRSWAEYSDDDGDALMLGDFAYSDMGLVDAIMSCSSGGSDSPQSSWLEQLMFPSLLARMSRLEESVDKQLGNSVIKLKKNVVTMHHVGPGPDTDNDNDTDNDSDSDSDSDSEMPYQLRFLKKIG
jgi:hypothetical protein